MDHLAALEGEVVAMAAAFRSADLAREVVPCPGWTVQDLMDHLTAVHRWVLGALRDEGAPPYDDSVTTTADDYEAAARELVAHLEGLPAEAPCWTFNREDRTTGFWRRRQLHEVSVHRWDVEQHELDPRVAADGIEEVLTFFLPRQLATGRAALPVGRLALEADGHRWTVVADEGPEAVVRADAPTLNLLLWGRRTLEDTDVEGDVAFAKDVFSARLTP